MAGVTGRWGRSSLKGGFGIGCILMALSVTPKLSFAAELLPGQSVQQAIDGAQVGDVIVLGAGTFSGPLSLRSGVELVGAGSGNTVIQGTLVIPADATGVIIRNLTAGGLSAQGQDFLVSHTTFTGTVQSTGGATGRLQDVLTQSYVAVDGNSSLRFEQSQLEQTAFVRDAGQAHFNNCNLLSYSEVQANGRAWFEGGSLNGAFISGQGQATLSITSSAGNLGVRGQGQLIADGSALALVTWEEGAYVALTDVTLGSALLKVGAGVQATVQDVGPGLVVAGSASASNSTFGASLSNVQVGTVAYDIAGGLLAQGGGLNGYSYVRDGAQARFEDFDYAQYSIVEGSGQAWFVDSQLRADLIARGTAGLSFIRSESSQGAVQLEGEASARVEQGSALAQVLVRAAGQLQVLDASVAKLILTVESGFSTLLEGLTPGVLSGDVGVEGPLGGPSLHFQDGTLQSVQLWVRGQADVRNSRIDDYLVVEADGSAQLLNTSTESVAVVRGNGVLNASGSVAGPFLYVEGAGSVDWVGGELRNFVGLKDQSSSRFEQVALNANLESSGNAHGLFLDAHSIAHTLKIRGESFVEVGQGSALYGLTVTEHGHGTISNSHLTTLTLDVAVGDDVTVTGLKPGVFTGQLGPVGQGPQAALSSTQIDNTSLLVHGSAHLQNTGWNGYTFVYENAISHFEQSDLQGVTYLLAGSHNTLTGGRIESLLNVQSAINRFDGVRFTGASSSFIGGSSRNTFVRCVFEKALTLSDTSVNDLGTLGGDANASGGENDFSLVVGSFKLANNTPNAVNAQNNVWGSEVSSEIAAAILDQADDSTWGPVNFAPFKVKNRPPLVSAGSSLSIGSLDQEGTVVVGQASDPDLDGMSYRWLENGLVLLDDSPVGADGLAPLTLSQVPFLGAGDHVLTLEVTDSYGYTVTSDMVLTIGNSAPLVSAIGGGAFSEGEAIELGGELSDYDGDVIHYTWRLGSRVLADGLVATVVEGELVAVPSLVLSSGLPVGSHTLVLEVSDGVNLPTQSSVRVDVSDLTPPVLSPVANPALLWPPTGDMRPVVIDTYAMDSSGSPVTLTARVSSNEPKFQSYFGKADWTTPVIDAKTGAISLKLRAEANISGVPREYTIWVTAKDKAGNTSQAQVAVRVAWKRGMWCF